MKNKKYIIILLICFVVLITLLVLNSFVFVTKVMKCTFKEEKDNYNINTTYKVYYMFDNVRVIEEKEVLTSKNTTLVKLFEKNTKDRYNKEYKGYTFNTINKGSKLITNITLDFRKLNMKEYIKGDTIIKAYVNDKNKLTIKNAKKMYKEIGAKCK